MTTPRVSVLVPVFNTRPYLLQALESLSAQTFRDFEIVVIDDGSTDGSVQLLQAYAAREPRMRLIARDNRGVVETRNELLATASAEHVAWMDSDDISTSDRLALQADRFHRDPALVCVGGLAQCIDPAGRPLKLERYPAHHADIVHEQRQGGGFRFPTTMMRRNAAIELGGFRAPFPIGEDFDLLLRLAEAGKTANIQRAIYLYRQRLDSVCTTLGPRWLAYRKAILELANERRSTGSDRLQRGASIEILVDKPSPSVDLKGQAYAYWSSCALQMGDRRRAREYAVCALRASPADIANWKALLRGLLSTGGAQP